MPSPQQVGRNQHRRWLQAADQDLLELRFSELRLSIRQSPLAFDLAELYATLERRGIHFRPHVWLSTEWFSPDGIPGIAVPFYLAHPRLLQLERRMKGEAEGSNRAARRQLLRHEAGHALDTAFGLRRRADWRASFGRASRPYPRAYSARPASRRFVQHIGHWYAQAHPTEDFAETFAVWLQPRARWRREYAGWPALRKLEYVDTLMTEIAGRRPPNQDRSTAAGLQDNRRRLRDHYRRSYAPADLSERRYDAWLYRNFVPRSIASSAERASTYLRSIEPELRAVLTRRADTGSYLAAHVTATLRRRVRELDLAVNCGRREAKRRAVRLHERVIVDLLHRNRESYLL